MKRTLAALGLLTPGLASAQVSLPLRDVVRTVQDSPFRVPLQQVIPTQPQGFPAPTEPKELPPPQGDLNRVEFIRGNLRKNGPIFTLGTTDPDGEKAELIYRGYRIFADRIDGSTETNIVRARGNVRLIGEDAQVSGDEVDFDFRTRVYTARQAKARIGQELTGGNIRGDLFVRGGSSGTRQRFSIENGGLTTCPYDRPHFSLDARSGVVRPNREARLKDVRLRILGKTVARFGSLWIPLADREYEYLPRVGQSQDEGYFVKNRYGFPIRGNDAGDVRLDYMEKLGAGLGAGYLYRNAKMLGVSRIYGITGTTNTLTVHNEHEQLLSFGRIKIENDFQRANYLTVPGSTVLNTRALFTLNNRAAANTTIGLLRNSNEAGEFTTENQTISISDIRPLGRYRTDLKLDYADSKSTAAGQGQRRETMDVRFRGQRELARATATLEYQRTVPIGQVENFFGGSDRTPVLSLASDARRLIGRNFDKILPFTGELSLGEYGDPIGDTRVSRGAFLLDARRPSQSVGPWRFDLNGRYRQSAYSDDTAQYTLSTGAAVGYRVGRRLELNARYNYLRPYGYSPLLIDRSGTTNIITLDATSEPIRNFRLGAQTGFDITRLQTQDTGWQQVGLRAEYGVGREFLFRALATYDSFQEVWSNVRLDAQIVRGTANIAIGTRYDGIRHTFGNVNVFADGLQFGRTRFAAILAYNGYLNRFDSQQIQAVYDLHDAEAVFTYSDYGTGFRSGRELRFFIRLKAFPFFDNFGLGRQGQPLGTATGRDF